MAFLLRMILLENKFALKLNLMINEKRLLFGYLIALILCVTLVQAAEYKNQLSHRKQQPMSAIFLELTPLTPSTLDYDFYQIETMLQASNSIILEFHSANSGCICPPSST